MRYVFIFYIYVFVHSLQAASTPSLGLETKIPFQVIHGLIVVEMTVDGSRGHYILDTGAEQLVLNRTPEREDLTVLTAQGDRIAQQTSAQLSLGHAEITEVDAWIVDLHGLLPSIPRDLKIDGLVGSSVLASHDILIDFGQRQISILHQASISDVAVKGELVKIPILNMVGQMPIIEAEIEDRIYRMGIDSGSNINLIDADQVDFRRDQHYDLSIGNLRLMDLRIGVGNLPIRDEQKDAGIQGIISLSAFDADQVLISTTDQVVYICYWDGRVDSPITERS
ncbi:MAG: hypothetical protein AAFQ02_12255 [Bacteroidota bacterium]